MDQSRLIVFDKDTGFKNTRPSVRRIFCDKLTVGKDTDHRRCISVDKVPTADASLCHRLIHPLGEQFSRLRDLCHG